MSSLGENGRFGNQLFQYLYVVLVAKRQNAVLQTPHWIGNVLYNLRDPQALLRFSVISEDALEQGLHGAYQVLNPASLLETYLPCVTDADFFGYFQLHTSFYASYKDFIRSLFTPRGGYAELIKSVNSQIKGKKKRVLAIHLRRGDYGRSMYFRAPCAWYCQWLLESEISPTDTLIYIASEAPEPYLNRFPGFTVLTFNSLKNLPSQSAFLVDFHVMCEADILLISNSTFSFFASLLNYRATSFYRPDAILRCLVAYDPWDAAPLLKTQIPKSVHAEFIKMDEM